MGATYPVDRMAPGVGAGEVERTLEDCEWLAYTGRGRQVARIPPFREDLTLDSSMTQTIQSCL